MDFNGKTIVIGVTGGIAAYKACELVSLLKKRGADIHVVMTKNATEFVSPLTFQTLSNNNVITDMFDRIKEWEVEHISLAKKADLFIIAPCTANVIGKIACGIADDFLTTTVMATKAPVLFAPAMNTGMLTSAAYQQNFETLKKRGYYFIDSESGLLACGDVGNGRLAEPARIVEAAERVILQEKDFAGKTILITAGATIEPIDPVRYISNYSSGKMGLSIASAAVRRGAEVILVTGSITEKIDFECTRIEVKTTAEMLDAVLDGMKKADIIVKAAAPSDYRVTEYSGSKIKDKELILKLEKNPDIAMAAGKIKKDKKLIIFAAETENLIENARKKLKSKNADMVIANDVTKKGAGFGTDTNIVSIITKTGYTDYDLMEKRLLADVILDNIQQL